MTALTRTGKMGSNWVAMIAPTQTGKTVLTRTGKTRMALTRAEKMAQPEDAQARMTRGDSAGASACILIPNRSSHLTRGILPLARATMTCPVPVPDLRCAH